VAAAAGLSVLVEVTQYAVGRAADIDDVLLNTAGALIGALVARIVVAAVSVLRRGRAEAGAANRIG
jgi:glycopeptide antibiotics resistance protein